MAPPLVLVTGGTRGIGKAITEELVKAGVLLAGAARTYINRFAAIPGRRLAIFTSTESPV